MNPSFWLQSRLDTMPPVRAMQVSVQHCHADALTLMAPLLPNINDKGTAFGGSLSALMTLAGWGLVSARLHEAGHRAEVYVADSEVRYLAPLRADLVARAWAPQADWDDFIATFASRGKARIALAAEILLPDGQPACTLQGRYVALR